MGISPSVSVQTTLDGGVYEIGIEESEVHKAPCDEKCWRAVEKRCVCRCGGVNHGAAYRNLTSLDEFGGVEDEGMPVVAQDIARGKAELLWFARREVMAAYTVALGGRK